VRPMRAQLESNDVMVVAALKEAFETGRSVSICMPGREEPVGGCVSHILETTGLDGYLFSAFVGDQRVMIKEAPSAISELRSTTLRQDVSRQSPGGSFSSAREKSRTSYTRSRWAVLSKRGFGPDRHLSFLAERPIDPAVC